MIEVITYPNKILKTKSEIATDIDKYIISVINNLHIVIDTYSHCIGIAAVQLGITKRIIAIDVSKTKNKNHGRIIMINPQILESSSETIITKEGCLSVPDYTAYVTRPKKVTVKYIDMNGSEQFLEAKRFEAVVIQHEIDHLDGILFIDKVSSTNDLIRRG